MTATILSADTVKEAAKVLKSTTGPIDVVIGNRIFPVDIPDWEKFVASHGGKRGLSVRKQYWDYLEAVRLYSENGLPHINYLCLDKLIRRGLVKNLVTTNYDRYLVSLLSRQNLGPWQLNPIPRRSIDAAMSDNDGYLNLRPKADAVSLYKIHGDLGFAWMQCGHICRLPQFMVSPFSPTGQAKAYLKARGVESLHSSLPTGKGVADPSFTSKHSAQSYEHHTDYGKNRDLFRTERRAALSRIGKNTQGILVVGLSMRPKRREDLVDPIVKRAKAGVPIIYIVATTNLPLQEGESELVTEVERVGGRIIVINEVSPDGGLDLALVQLLEQMGETSLDADYDDWQTNGDWWTN